LDVNARAENDHYNIEAQISPMQHMPDRMIFNSNRILSLGTPSGTDYENLPKITVISLLNFSYRRNHPDFHQTFGLFYEKDPERVTEKFDYHMIEIPKFRKIRPDFSNPLHRWLYYLDIGYKDPDNPIMKEVFQMDQGLLQFAQKYQRNINDPATRNAYYGYVMECMDERERIRTARIEAKAEGADMLAELIKKGYDLNTALRMVKENANQE
jgi:predicted transposase/invertase (TIGR01784 family)